MNAFSNPHGSRNYDKDKKSIQINDFFLLISNGSYVKLSEMQNNNFDVIAIPQPKNSKENNANYRMKRKFACEKSEICYTMRNNRLYIENKNIHMIRSEGSCKVYFNLTDQSKNVLILFLLPIRRISVSFFTSKQFIFCIVRECVFSGWAQGRSS